MCRWIVCLLWLMSVSAWAEGRSPLDDAFDMQVTYIPAPAVVSGKSMLVYELHLTNFSAAHLRLQDLQVVGEAGTLLELSGDALTRAMGRPDLPAKGSDPLLIPAGVRAVVYLAVDAPDLAHRHISQVIRFSREDGSEATAQGGGFDVASSDPVILGAPLKGGPWVAVYSAQWTRGHRRVLYTVAGKVRIPGRFAIDWIKVDNAGKHAHGDGSRPAQWLGYGEPVLAVADAVVSAAMDDLPEPTDVRADRRVAMQDAAGNYVALDLGQGRHVFYEHLKPGSIKVHAGDRVKRGQVIALLGYTGSTTGPHLHLHVSDGTTPLDAEGVPYAFGQFERLGRFSDARAFGESQAWIREGSQLRRGELPGSFDVVQFDTP